MKSGIEVSPDTVWKCPHCDGLNNFTCLQCYSCHHPRPPQFSGNLPIAANIGVFPVSDKGAGVKTPGRGRKTTRESELQAACERWLRFHGIEFLHLSPMAREKIGWPDLVFCINGKAFAVELKSAAGKLTDRQEEILSAMGKNGWTTAVCRTLEEFTGVVGNGFC